MPKVTIQGDSPFCYEAQNFILRRGKAVKVPGTNRYNQTLLPAAIKWGVRYYGRRADNTYTKKTFCYSDGNIYLGNDVTGVLTASRTGLYKNCYPEHVVVQVAGNSRMYLFNGYDTPVYYEGDDNGSWQNSAITYRFVQGVIKDDRLWSFERDSSILYGSRTSNPEDYSSTYVVAISIGAKEDSYIKRIELLGNDLYIFKNDSIWVLTGSTKATYNVEELIPGVGIIAQRALARVKSGIIFVSQQDKEIYEFVGTINLKRLSDNMRKPTSYRKGNFKEMLDLIKTDSIVCRHDTINELFRISFNDIESRENYNNAEVIFPTDDFNERGLPKWSTTYGAGVGCYIVADRQGDDYLMTGYDKEGRLFYHNRGWDWDNIPMTTRIRYPEVIGDEGNNCDFDSIYIKGRPSIGTITARTYLNTREVTNSSQTLADLGEREVLGQISMPAQYSFNNWKPLLTGYNHGESMSVEIVDSTNQKEIEIERIILDVIQREKIMSSHVGG